MSYFNKILKAATLFCILVFITLSQVRAQKWVEKMNQPNSNFYEVDELYQAWQDSVNARLGLTSSGRTAYSDEIKTLQKLYKHWARDFMPVMDRSGNRLSSEQVERQSEYNAKFNLPYPGIQVSGNWTPIGPTYIFPNNFSYGNGVVGSVAVHPLDTSIIFVRSGGFWRTFNGGTYWEPLTDSAVINTGACLAFEPGTGNILYLSIGSTLYKSLDSGNTVIAMNAPPDFVGSAYTLIIDPVNTQNLYLPGSLGVAKSADGGATWSVLLNEYTRDFELNPLNPETIFILGTNKIYRSFNGGLTLDSINLSMPWVPQDMAVTPADSSYIYVYAGQSGGSSGNDGMVALSTDGGTTFNNQPVSSNLYTFNYWLKRIFVSPTNKDEIYFAGIFLHKSLDAGITWSPLTNLSGLPYMHVDQRAITNVGNTFWFANDGGLYKTDDGGSSFIDLTGNMQITNTLTIACSPTDSNAILLGTTHNGAILQTDSGWTNLKGGDGVSVAIHPTNSLDLFYKDQYGYAHSIDGGLTFSYPTGITENQYSFTPDYPLVYNFQNPSSVYTVKKNVFKSVDGGFTFSPISNFATDPFMRGIMYVNPNDSSFIYANGHRSTDGGITWTLLNQFSNRIAVDNNAPWRLWSASREFGKIAIKFSQDTGNTWQSVQAIDLPYQLIVDFEYVNNGYDGLFLVLQKGVYYIDNRLSNWQPFTNNLPVTYYGEIAFVENINKVRLATNGRGVWESPLYDPSQPLVADFLADRDTTCPGGEVNFFDNSLNNGPGFNPTYSWSFPGGIPSTSSSAFPSIVYPIAGIYPVSLVVSNSNGVDSITKASYIHVQPPPISVAPLTEGFEISFPPPDWSTEYPPNTPNSWYWTNAAGGYGLSDYSARFYNNSGGNLPNVVAFYTNIIDLSGLQNSVLLFDHAYAMDTLLNADSLRVFYSTDCGLNRTYFYSTGGTNMATAPPTYYTFTPDSSQWTTDTVSLSGLPMQLQLGFEAVDFNGNCLFIDNINIMNGPSTTEAKPPVSSLAFSIYPIPASDEVMIVWDTENENSATGSFFNSLGQIVLKDIVIIKGTNQIDIKSINPGFYMVRLLTTNGIVFRSLIIE